VEGAILGWWGRCLLYFEECAIATRAIAYGLSDNLSISGQLIAIAKLGPIRPTAHLAIAIHYAELLVTRPQLVKPMVRAGATMCSFGDNLSLSKGVSSITCDIASGPHRP
jgi:hypothetical protein